MYTEADTFEWGDEFDPALRPVGDAWLPDVQDHLATGSFGAENGQAISSTLIATNLRDTTLAYGPTHLL